MLYITLDFPVSALPADQHSCGRQRNQALQFRENENRALLSRVYHIAEVENGHTCLAARDIGFYHGQMRTNYVRQHNGLGLILLERNITHRFQPPWELGRL